MNMTPTLQESQKLLRDASAEIKEIAESITQVSMQAKKDRLLECLETIKNADDKIEQSINFMYFGQKSGGQRKTARKIKAVQENGKKGGRPSKKILQTLEKSQEGDKITVSFSDGSQTEISGSAFDIRTRFPLSRYRWSDEAEEWFTKNC